ncbi:MAG: redoxin domain-containing protein [Planctomycetales bacterium]|nr:redoxin domain-containing protein [Planctomycetales bacterium]
MRTFRIEWNSRHPWLFAVLALLGGMLLPGCGKSDATTPSAAGNSATGPAANSSLPTASIGNQTARSEDDGDDEPDTDDMQPTELKEGSADWLVRECMRIRIQPPPKTDDVEELRKNRKERNEQIVQHAQQAIQLTHNDAERERLFSAAIHHLMEARLQLALQGDRDSIDGLYDDAEALWKRDPESQAASESAHTLVNMAYGFAKSGTKKDSRWLQEFARQATHFAQNFPKHEAKSLPLLFTAARSCELHGMFPEASACYKQVVALFPQTSYAARSTAVLRRLNLPGQSVQLSGPTLAGGQVAVEDFSGKVVLVVFWSTEAKPFEQQLPALQAAIQKFRKQPFAVVGISLDKDRLALEDYVARREITWPQIFFDDEEKQSWNHPIVSYYGVMDVPMLWVIDRQGKVASVNVKADEVETTVESLLSE